MGIAERSGRSALFLRNYHAQYIYRGHKSPPAAVVSCRIDALERLAGVEVKTQAFAYLGAKPQEGGVSANRR